MAEPGAVPKKPTLLDLETEAIDDLGARVRRLRRRVLLPALVVWFVAAHVSVAAHFMGRLAIAGQHTEGSSFVSTVTGLLAALLLPIVPIVGPAGVAYVALRARMRAAWRREHAAKGVPEEVLGRNVARFG